MSPRILALVTRQYRQTDLMCVVEEGGQQQKDIKLMLWNINIYFFFNKACRLHDQTPNRQYFYH